MDNMLLTDQQKGKSKSMIIKTLRNNKYQAGQACEHSHKPLEKIGEQEEIDSLLEENESLRHKSLVEGVEVVLKKRTLNIPEKEEDTMEMFSDEQN